MLICAVECGWKQYRHRLIGDAYSIQVLSQSFIFFPCSSKVNSDRKPLLIQFRHSNIVIITNRDNTEIIISAVGNTGIELLITYTITICKIVIIHHIIKQICPIAMSQRTK